ncbi:HET-domain-containing protein [Gyrodon lividus]|nr:HET-domain-containing protein [Gyrodon lividus]
MVIAADMVMYPMAEVITQGWLKEFISDEDEELEPSTSCPNTTNTPPPSPKAGSKGDIAVSACQPCNQSKIACSFMKAAKCTRQESGGPSKATSRAPSKAPSPRLLRAMMVPATTPANRTTSLAPGPSPRKKVKRSASKPRPKTPAPKAGPSAAPGGSSVKLKLVFDGVVIPKLLPSRSISQAILAGPLNTPPLPASVSTPLESQVSHHMQMLNLEGSGSLPSAVIQAKPKHSPNLGLQLHAPSLEGTRASKYTTAAPLRHGLNPDSQRIFDAPHIVFFLPLVFVLHLEDGRLKKNDEPETLATALLDRRAGARLTMTVEPDMRLVTREEIKTIFQPLMESVTEADFVAEARTWYIPKQDCWTERWFKLMIQRRLKFAIFSHRWGVGEPSFRDVSKAIAIAGPGYRKLLMFCEKAKEYGCTYVWSDTCCIDKTSSAELEEAIRSMFRWYRSAEECITYLSESSTLEDFETEPWFSRGWTLQELLAPQRIRFYGKNWLPLLQDTKPKNGNDTSDTEMLKAIQKRAKIPDSDLNFFVPKVLQCTRLDLETANRLFAKYDSWGALPLFTETIPITTTKFWLEVELDNNAGGSLFSYYPRSDPPS